MREIVNTSENSGAVGYRVLCCCYPMQAAGQIYLGNRIPGMLPAEANRRTPSFGYYEAGRDQMLQAAPTTVGVGIATADNVAFYDPARNYGYTRLRMLSG